MANKRYKLTLSDNPTKSDTINCDPLNINARIESFLRTNVYTLWIREDEDIEVLVEDLSENPEPKYYAHFSPVMDVIGYNHDYDEDSE